MRLCSSGECFRQHENSVHAGTSVAIASVQSNREHNCQRIVRTARAISRPCYRPTLGAQKKPGQGYTNDDRTSTRYSMILIVYVVSESAYSAFASLERKHRAKQSAATNTMIPAISVCPTQNIPPAMTTETKPKMSLYSAFSW